MGRFKVEIQLANHIDKVRAEQGDLAPEKVRRTRLAGVVDSGAAYLVIPKAIATQLGVPEAGKATVRYADRRSARRSVVRDVDVELFGREGTFKAIVEPRREDALIGAIVLEDLDLLVDCTNQRLQPRDPTGIIAEIE